jgi:hypothetical protein
MIRMTTTLEICDNKFSPNIGWYLLSFGGSNKYIGLSITQLETKHFDK